MMYGNPSLSQPTHRVPGVHHRLEPVRRRRREGEGDEARMGGVRAGAARVLGGGLRRRGGVVVGRLGRRVIHLLGLLDVRGLGRRVRDHRWPVAREERRRWARAVGWLEEMFE